MFTALFYGFGILALIWEIMLLTGQSRKAVNELNKILTGPENAENIAKTITPNQTKMVIMNTLYILWVIVGIFSSQWPLFILLLVISLSTDYLRKKKFSFYDKYWVNIDAILCLVAIIFIWINKYHLHIHWKTFFLG